MSLGQLYCCTKTVVNFRLSRLYKGVFRQTTLLASWELGGSLTLRRQQKESFEKKAPNPKLDYPDTDTHRKTILQHCSNKLLKLNMQKSPLHYDNGEKTLSQGSL